MSWILLVCAIVLLVGCNLLLSATGDFAFGKECKQSSLGITRYGKEQYCSLANDGNKTRCSRTRFQNEVKWWLVDLKTTVQVQSVVITNNPQYPGRLRDFTIKTYHMDPLTFYPYGHLCYQYAGKFPPNTETVNCTEASTGRFVKITKLEDYKTIPLNICEVEVYGVEIPTQMTGGGYCENQTSKMDPENYLQKNASTSIECARKCEYEASCLGFNYDNDAINNNCILITESGPITHTVGVSYWTKCAQLSELSD